MVLTNINSEDIVECDVKGRRFYALVVSRQKGALDIKPINKGITYYHVKANCVVAHFRRMGKARNGNGAAAPEPQLSDNPFIRKAQLKEGAT